MFIFYLDLYVYILLDLYVYILLDLYVYILLDLYVYILLDLYVYIHHKHDDTFVPPRFRIKQQILEL